MLKPIASLLMGLALAACQHNNPYQGQSTPVPPAPAMEQTQLPSAHYPATPWDFSVYRNWSWHSPPAAVSSLSSQELQEVIAGALEQRGLRPATDPSGSDLRIAASVALERRLRQAYDDYDPYFATGRYGSGYGAWYRVPTVRTWEEEVVAVRIQLYDAKSSQVIWSNQAEARSADSRAGRKDAVRKAINRALADYPPH